MNVIEPNVTPITPCQQSINDSYSTVVEIDPAKPSVVGKKELPISELSCKLLLTIDEAARYTGLGLQKLREISNTPNCQMIMWNGSKRMFKRKKLEEYLYAQYSI